MIFKTIVFIGLLGGNIMAASAEPDVEHLELEVIVEGGERKMFPLLPGTKCPAGHRCRESTANKKNHFDTRASIEPMISSLKKNIRTPLAMSLDWEEMGNNLNTLVASNDYCTRRSAMARAAGLAAGVGIATVSSPAYAAETKTVLMGADSGLLQFVPQQTSICKGDSVKWINNKAGPHNVVFDEDDIPGGVDQEKISMDDQLGEEGDSFTMKFDVGGNYGYYCEPHRGAGMTGKLTVS